MMIDETQLTLDREIEEFLAHHGVKGMHWGVRRDRRVQRIADAGVKGGSKSAKVLAITNRHLGPIDIIKGRGITGGAARKATRIQARSDRVRAGKAHIGSKLIHYGSVHVSDIVPVKGKNMDKKTIMDKHALVLAGVGALFVAKQLQKRAAG